MFSGQKIPAGLHVSMDFETGKKFAKLLDDPKQQQQKEKAPESQKQKRPVVGKPGARDNVKFVRPEPMWKKRRRERRNKGKDSRVKSWDAGKKIGRV